MMLTPGDPSKGARQSANKRAAGDVEAVARNRLIGLGCERVERIPDHWIPQKKMGPSSWLCRRGGRKLDGDVRAFYRGWPVLVECKRNSQPTLPYSTLKAHQHEALSYYHTNGMIALVAWLSSGYSSLIIFPYGGFQWQRGRSIPLDKALACNIQGRSDLDRLIREPDGQIPLAD